MPTNPDVQGRAIYVKPASVTAQRGDDEVLTPVEALAEFKERLQRMTCSTTEMAVMRDALLGYFRRGEQAEEAEVKESERRQAAVEQDRAEAAAQNERARIAEEDRARKAELEELRAAKAEAEAKELAELRAARAARTPTPA